MTLNEIKEVDEALYNTIDCVTYNTISYEFVDEKNYGVFIRENGVYRTTLTESQKVCLASFISAKLQDNERMRLRFYEESKNLILSPEMSMNVVSLFILYNLKRYKIDMKNSDNCFNKLKSLLKKNRKQNLINQDCIGLMSNINTKTEVKRFFDICELIYNKYKFVS